MFICVATSNLHVPCLKNKHYDTSSLYDLPRTRNLRLAQRQRANFQLFTDMVQVVGIFLLRFRVQCTNLYTYSYNFEFNLEFIYMSVFQKVSKLHEPLGRMQFELFEKHTSANKLQIEQEKSNSSL